MALMTHEELGVVPTEVVRLAKSTPCRWEVAIRNPFHGPPLDPHEWFEVFGARCAQDGRDMALAILENWPWLVTSVRPRRRRCS